MLSSEFDFVIEVQALDRKSTRLNSSHLVISYAVFCLKKKDQALVSQQRLTDRLTRGQNQLKPVRDPLQLTLKEKQPPGLQPAQLAMSELHPRIPHIAC